MMYNNFGFSGNRATGRYHYESDDDEDDLDRAVAHQIEYGGAEFNDNDPAMLNAAAVLRSRGVNIGLPTQTGRDVVGTHHHRQIMVQNLAAAGGVGADIASRHMMAHQHQQQQGQNGQHYLSDSGGGYGARVNISSLDPASIAAGGGGGGFGGGGFDPDTIMMTSQNGSSGLDVPLHDIMAFDKEQTAETVCSKLEKIMPFYDESLYYACKEYIFQHALYHKHHLRSIGLSGVPLRYRLLSLWQRPLATSFGKCYFFFETLLVGLSLVQVVLETIPAYSTVVSPGWERTWMLMELPTSICFLLDIIVHLIVLPSFPNDYSVYSRSSFVKSAEFWVDVGSILPTIFMFVAIVWPFLGAFDFLKILRVLRFAKVLRQFSSVDQLANTVERSIKPLVAPFVFLFVAVMVTSGLIYFAEKGEYDEQRKMFMQPNCDCESSAPAVLNPHFECPPVPAIILSVPHAMWFSVVTMSTVGYGDLVPRCLLGRIIGTFTILCGSVILAMPIAIVGTYFTDVVAQSQRSSGHENDLERTPFHVQLTGEGSGDQQKDALNGNSSSKKGGKGGDDTGGGGGGGSDHLDESGGLLDSGSSSNILTSEGGSLVGRSATTTPVLTGGKGNNSSLSRLPPSASAAAAAANSSSADLAAASGANNSSNSNNNVDNAERIRRRLAPKSDTPGVRLIHFLAECNHHQVPLINPSPLVIHQINSFVKKEIETFLRSLHEPGRAPLLRRDFYNSTTNFTLVPYRDRRARVLSVLQQQQQQQQSGETADLFSNTDDGMMLVTDDGDAKAQKARFAAKLAEDDYAHDVRVALSQKGDKAPICLRTVPIVLCGPQMASQFMDSASGGGGFSADVTMQQPGKGGADGGGDGGNKSASASPSGGGGASPLGSGLPVGPKDTPMTVTRLSHRGFPSGATLVPYCAPGCEIPGVPSPFAILWVCPMTNFVSITAVFPVCVTVNGREAPNDTPQRLLFGDQICVHATGPNSRPLLTYRFTRAEAPVIAGVDENNNNNNNNTKKKDGNNNDGAGDGRRGGAGNINGGDQQQQQTFRVRSLPESMPEYRAYALSKYSTTFNSGVDSFYEL